MDDDFDEVLAEAGIPARPRGLDWYARISPAQMFHFREPLGYLDDGWSDRYGEPYFKFILRRLQARVPVVLATMGERGSSESTHVADFDRAIEPVLTDLRVTGGPLPVSIGPLYEDPGFSLIRSFAGEHGTRGIRMPVGHAFAEQIVFVADEVQEWVVEENWGRDSNWPKCPQHPTTHPLEAAVLDGDAVWRCPASLAPIAGIGDLRQPAQ